MKLLSANSEVGLIGEDVISSSTAKKLTKDQQAWLSTPVSEQEIADVFHSLSQGH